jgi:hypothetical protein
MKRHKSHLQEFLITTVFVLSLETVLLKLHNTNKRIKPYNEANISPKPKSSGFLIISCIPNGEIWTGVISSTSANEYVSKINPNVKENLLSFSTSIII